MTGESIFLAAIDLLDSAARDAYLTRVCRGDAVLRDHVEALLAAHARTGDFLDVPVGGQLGAHTARQGDAELSFLLPPTQAGALGRLGHYEVLGVIGRGGFGIVLKAFDVTLHRVVAIKVIAPELASASPARKRFLREARAGAAVRDENIVQIHAVEEHPLPYLVMEFIAGETLQQRLDRIGPFDVPEVIRLGRQIAGGIAAAHALGLVHCDIKPSNILLTDGPEARVKITDFGLARTVNDASLNRSGVIAGTPMYMSPEQAAGRRIDLRADLFSLGSVLYVMCSGRPPFRATTMMGVLRRVCDDAPRPIQEVIPEVPAWLCEVVARLHAKAPGDRFQSAAEVAEALTRCATARPPVPFPRRRQLAAAVGLLVLIAATAGGVGAFLRPGEAGPDEVALPPDPRSQQETTVAAVPPDPRAQWEATLTGLPPDERIRAVGDRLKSLNPGFNSELASETAGGVVVMLKMSVKGVTDISPVHGLTSLKFLQLNELGADARSPLDLSPLAGMKLEEFMCEQGRLSDISPLRGMPLRRLHIGMTDVNDLYSPG